MKLLSFLYFLSLQLLLIGSISAQTYSGSRVVNASRNMEINVAIDPSQDLIEITMTGPTNVWYAYGFGTNRMTNCYTILTDGNGNISERKLGNHNAGSALNSSFLSSSFSQNGGIGTTIVTRSLSGMTGDYYTFQGNEGTITIIWGFGNGANLAYHGGRGATTLPITLDCEATTSSITETACNEYRAPSGQVFTSSGTYEDIIPNSAGCDSIITIDLTILESPVTNLTITACDEYTSPSGSQIWTTSGNYTDIFTRPGACDSIVNVDLTIFNKQFNTISASTCDEYISPSGNYIWNATGSYNDTIPTTNGCDSIITVNLTVLPPTFSQINVNTCGVYTSPSRQYTFTETGTYQDTISNAEGCDSIITINLTIEEYIYQDIEAFSCNSYLSPSGQFTWTNSGTYQDTIINSDGCDSVFTVELTLAELDTAIIQNGTTLTANATGYAYQWLDCNNNFAPIPNETNRSFTSDVEGAFALQVTLEDCVDTSSCYNVTILGVEDYGNIPEVTLYPNPTSSSVTLDWKTQQPNVSYIIFNAIGEVVKSKTISNSQKAMIDIQGQSGVYTIKLMINNEVKVLKLIKQ